ncbi:sensor histidine kinase [Catelliglobosispora koreensis]|uniref:sensor histidine kinase n=1 Tax=Catelliglobosispora koreensis TaxID=129052 RepID=UPI00035FA7C5|nr:ATP-binding protein [Catelliglobosispora koreensis]
MSSNRRSSWPLRTRLIAIFAGLLVLTSAIVGVLTTVALERFLADRLDTQLSDILVRTKKNEGNAPSKQGGQGGQGCVPTGDSIEGAPPHGPNFLTAPGIPDQTVGALIRNGNVVADIVVAAHGYPERLPANQAEPLASVPANSKPSTLDIPGLGEYRVAATKLSNGDTVVAGLPLDGVNETIWRLAGVVTLVSVIGIGAAALLGTIVVRRTLRPLDRVAATATRVSELELDRGTVALSERVPEAYTDPKTEVGKVGSALNRLLEHVAAALAARQASETRVRHFVADASHELRTPLAAIRGYAELTRRSKDQVPPDVAHAISRVESESARMTTLVEDLLLLARLDEGRPLADGAVDLSRLIVDVISDAQIAGPHHRWSLDLPADPVSVTGDDARLHQVFANLLANARTHTPQGTTVSVALSLEGTNAVVTIADNGPGIPPELQPEIFERFTRGDSSRSRAAGSTGLGLAIVSAVVAAHHGTVSVDSRPGRTVFTVRLPSQDEHRNLS